MKPQSAAPQSAPMNANPVTVLTKPLIYMLVFSAFIACSEFASAAGPNCLRPDPCNTHDTSPGAHIFLACEAAHVARFNACIARWSATHPIRSSGQQGVRQPHSQSGTVASTHERAVPAPKGNRSLAASKSLHTPRTETAAAKSEPPPKSRNKGVPSTAVSNREPTRRSPTASGRPEPPRARDSMQPADAGATAVPEMPGSPGPSNAQNPCINGPGSPGCILGAGPPPPPQVVLSTQAPRQLSAPLPVPAWMTTLPSLDYSVGPELKPSNSPCVGCDDFPSAGPIDLLADPRGMASAEDLLTPEQKKKMDQKIEEWVRDKIKDLRYKPFEAAFEEQKKAVQEAAGEYGGTLAVALCGGNLLCGPIGFGAGWVLAGKAFDTAIETPLSSITSGSSAPPAVPPPQR
jgi:hypothetical protein